MHPICFMIRNRPQNADIIDLVLRENRAFVGYAPVRNDMWHQDYNFKDVIFDISDFDDRRWQSFKNSWPKKDTLDSGEDIKRYSLRHATTYRNLLWELEKNKKDDLPPPIVVVPRPSEGLVYLGEYDGFELVHNPIWLDSYYKLRESQNLDIENKLSHARDVVQSFKVKKWVPVSMALIPAWIRRTLFGRSTIARIRPFNAHNSIEQTLEPYKYLKQLHDNPSFRKIIGEETTYETLINLFPPEPFEHLVIALLQCEHKKLRWLHVGGSGDGGVDGIGFDDNGKTKFLVQCKWQWDGQDVGLKSKKDCKVIVAYLQGDKCKNTDTHIYMNGHEIATLIEEHRRILPQAKTMGLI